MRPLIFFPVVLATCVLAPQIVATASSNQQEQSYVPQQVNDKIGRLMRENDAARASRDWARALKATTALLAIVRSNGAAGTTHHAAALFAQAQNLNSAFRLAEAEAYYRKSANLVRSVSGERSAHSFNVLTHLALNLLGQQKYAEALLVSRRAISIGKLLYGDEDIRVINANITLAAILSESGKLNEADTRLRRMIALLEATGVEQRSLAAAAGNLGENLRNQGRFAEAEQYLRKAVKLTRRSGGEQTSGFVIALNNLGLVLQEQGRLEEAESVLWQAVAQANYIFDRKHPLYATTLKNLALNVHAQGRNAEAEPMAFEALAVRKEALGAEHPDVANSLVVVASILASRGKSEEAEPHLRKALALTRQLFGPESFQQVGVLDSLATCLFLQGRKAEAKALTLKSLDIRRSYLHKDHPGIANALGNLMFLELSVGNHATEAYKHGKEAMSIFRKRRELFGSKPAESARREQLQGNIRGYADAYANALWTYAPLASHDMDSLEEEALIALQEAMNSPAGQAVVQMTSRRAAANDALAALARKRQALDRKRRGLESGLTHAVSATGSHGASQRERLDAMLDATIEDLKRVDNVLRRDHPSYFALIRPEPLRIDDTQGLLTADEAAIVLLPTRFGTHVMAVTTTELRWARAAWTDKETEAAVAKLRADLNAGSAPVVKNGMRLFRSFDRKTAHALYRQIVAPVADLLEGKSHVYVVAGGALSSLPFSVLVTEPPTGDDSEPADLRDTAWLGDKFALVRLPSLQSLQALRLFEHRDQDAGGADAPTFAGFGDPLLAGVPVERGKGGRGVAPEAVFAAGRSSDGLGLADPAKLRALNQLPGTRLELEELAAAFGAPGDAIHLRAEATETAVKRLELDDTDVIAFATHGLVAGDLEGVVEPGLVLTPPAKASIDDDGLLTASEVARLKLDADWVILSACNTAAGDGEGAPALSGLARAFFYAGAEALLVSHWPVRDDIAPRITVETIRSRQDDPSLSRAQALQRAIIAVRNDPSDPSKAHPAAWAPFTLVGDAR